MRDDPHIIPLTPAQEVLRAGQLLAGDGAPIYNMGWRFEIAGALDPDRFARALAEVASRHEALGLRIGPFGQSLGTPPEPCPMLELSPQEAEAQLRDDLSRPFDLAQASWRSRLIKLGEDRWLWVLCQHHLLADATTGQALFRAVSAAYQGKEPVEATQFGTVALRHADPKDEDGKPDHWADLASQPFDTDPPYGHARDPDQVRSHERALELGPERSARIDALAQEPGLRSISPDLSRFAIFAAIHAAWTYRTTRNSRICLGAPAHMRLTPADRAGLGLFAETLPFRLTVTPGMRFRDLAQAALAETQTWLRHARPGVSSAQTAKTFRSVLNYLPLEFGDFAGLETVTRLAHSGAHDPGHDLQLSITRFGGSGGPFGLHFRLNTAVFPEPDRVGTEWLTLCDGMLSDPDQAFDAVPLGGALVQGPEAQDHPLVLEAFAASLARHPDATAIVERGTGLSYRKLDARIAEFAEGCAAAGIGPGNIVLVCAKRSIDTVAAIWGILRAGAAYAPFPADTPPARLASVVAENGIRAAIQSPQTDALDLDHRITPQTPRTELPPVGAADCAYVMFTSGSTGAPKGVRVDHGGLALYTAWTARAFPGDHALNSSIGFDLTVTPLYVPFALGATLHVYPETGSPDLAMIEMLREDCVDHAKLTPTHLNIALESVDHVSRIQSFIMIGEALPTELARRARALSPRGAEVVNWYGPTEIIVAATAHWFDPAQDTGATVPIGRPGEGVEIAVLDAGDNPQPVGIAGEICVGGRMAMDYLGRPELTAERFQTVAGRRLYRTGDLGRVRGDGVIEYLGRMDEQLKISGMRIEPQEIVASLLTLPGIKRAHVGAVQPENGGTPELAAWIVGTGEPSQWRDALRAILPPEMVPARMALVDEIPLSASGKAHQAALPLPEPVRASDGPDFVPPLPGVEETLARLISEDRKIDRVGALDNFYDLGLDSLAAVRIGLRAVEAGIPMGVVDLLPAGSIRALAGALCEPLQSPVTKVDIPQTPLVSVSAQDMDAIRKALKGV